MASSATGRRRLRWAHNLHAIVKSSLGTVYEITPNTEGPILFDFRCAADVIDLPQSIEVWHKHVNDVLCGI
jgi:hypothetical protein